MILSLVLMAIALRLVAGFTPTLEVKGWLSAFLAAVLVLAVGTLAELAISRFLPAATLLQSAVLVFVGNLAAVALAAFVLPGLKLRGPLGLFLAAVLVTAIPFERAGCGSSTYDEKFGR